MSSKYIKKHPIPDGFEELLTEFTKEILRNQPLDIIDFGCEFFRCLQEGLLLDYEKIEYTVSQLDIIPTLAHLFSEKLNFTALGTNVFDEKANHVFDYYYDGKEIQYLSDKKFEDYLLKATRYKANLLRIATQELLAMKEKRK